MAPTQHVIMQSTAQEKILSLSQKYANNFCTQNYTALKQAVSQYKSGTYSPTDSQQVRIYDGFKICDVTWQELFNALPIKDGIVEFRHISLTGQVKIGNGWRISGILYVMLQALWNS